ncbi:MAG: hypothetical protein Q8N83_03620 [Ignavibacteria bacterium]|nr:hypothetical protein [Ignavibacteria bacterium]
MKADIELLQKEIDELIKQGYLLYYSLSKDFNKLSKDELKDLDTVDKIDFQTNYEKWYSTSLALVKQILPLRLEDFIQLYKNEKRKEVNFLTYTISDCIIGIRVTRGLEIKVDGAAALPKFLQQITIIESAKDKFTNRIYEIKNLVQADLFDSELEAAQELLKSGFNRGAGAVAGVVLEKHLSEVCLNHNLTLNKKNPTICDYNDLLKNSDVIEIPTWRFIQHLGDIRNLCDHKKTKEPTNVDVSDLISGVKKIIKTLF